MTEETSSDAPVTVSSGKGDAGFAVRLRAVLAGRSGAWLAKQIDITPQSVNAWLRGESEPSLSKAVAAALVLGVPVQWLATGQEDAAPPARPLSPPAGMSVIEDAYALLPRCEINLSAGPGLLPAGEDAGDRVAFSKDWLKRNRIDPARAGLVRVEGDSMAPTIPDGALALVDTAEARVDREGIYAFSRGGEACVKRLVPVAPGPGGLPTSVVIISDGGSSPPEFLTGPRLGELRITGRVRCILVNL